MLGRSALMTSSRINYGNWLGNYSDVSLLLRGNGTPGPLVPLDESPTPKTIIVFGNAGISTAVAKWNQGSGGSSLGFDGNGDYSTVASNAAFGYGTGDFTIEFWYYPTSFAAGSLPIIFDQRTSGFTEVVPTIYTTTAGVLYYYANGANRITGSTLVVNSWYHIAVARSATSTKMFVNGTQVGSTYSDSNNYATSLVSLGSYALSPSSYYISGYIDDLRITKGVARYVEGTGANVTKMVFAGTNDLAFPVLELGELPANITDDPSYNSVSLLLRNGTPGLVPLDESPIETRKTITAFGNAGISTTEFQYGTSSLSFDGSGDSITAPSGADFDFGTGDFTIEFWAYHNAVSTAIQTYFSLSSGGSTVSGFAVYKNASNAVSFNFYNNTPSATFLVLSANSAITSGQWYHVAVTREGNTFRLYLDGVRQGTNATSTLSMFSGRTPRIGAWTDYTGRDLNGFIDDFRITKGIARYVNETSFTPPPAELPNF